ncbi:hypothetical protein Q3G72_022309 [Acer saccharum]|nr:hypothetical protein Q3G72_022129 [Acer saccharum]KAK1550634.1 hypothetical protein Q3G72_022309 [Acer saccharum]
MLRDPPPHLLMLSATLPDEPPPVASVSEVKQTETVVEEMTLDAVKPESSEGANPYQAKQMVSSKETEESTSLDIRECAEKQHCASNKPAPQKKVSDEF